MSDQFLDEEGVPTAPSGAAIEVAHAQQVEAAPEPVVAEEPVQEPVEEPVEPKRSSRLVWLAALLGVIALASLAAAASLWSTLNSERDERTEVRRVAGAMAQAAHTYDHENLDETERKVLSLATGNFRREFERDFDGLAELIRRTKASSRATATDVYVAEIDDGTATTMVRLNTVSTGAVVRMLAYVEVRLVKVGGRWLVDGLEYVDMDTPVVNPPRAGTTTTTTPPK